MNGWVEKSAVLEHSKSLAIRGWLENFNIGVPCRVRKGRKGGLKEGSVYVEMRGPQGIKYQVGVPVEKVSIRHPQFVHTVRLSILPKLLEIMRPK